MANAGRYRSVMEEQLSRRPPERPGPAERIEGMNVLTTRVVGGNSCYGPNIWASR